MSGLLPSPLPLRLFVQAMLLWYTVSIFFVVLLSFWHEYRIQSLLQVLADMAMVTLVVYATGGVDSSLNFLYPLVIIVACILLPRSWAYLTAALAFILYGTILELTYFAVVPSYQTTHPGLRTLQAIILVNLFAFLAVAYLAALLSAKLRQVDVRLKTHPGRAAKPAGAPRKHHPSHQRRAGHDRPRRAHYPGQYHGADSARALGTGTHGPADPAVFSRFVAAIRIGPRSWRGSHGDPQ